MVKRQGNRRYNTSQRGGSGEGETSGYYRRLLNRVFTSTGTGCKIKGTYRQIVDKYTSMAREEVGPGSDRVLKETYLQYAEHYRRQLVRAYVMIQKYDRDREESKEPSKDSETQGESPRVRESEEGERSPGKDKGGPRKEGTSSTPDPEATL